MNEERDKIIIDEKVKVLAYKAIDENVEDTTARQIIRYTMECEIWGQDTISPTNQHLAKKFGWTVNTVKVAISLAKKSKFITTTGRGKTRCLELNVGFLKGKMAEVQRKQPLKKNLLEDIGKELGIESPNEIPHKIPNEIPNEIPNKSEAENSSTNLQNPKKGGDNNNNDNNNTSGENEKNNSGNVASESLPDDEPPVRKAPLSEEGEQYEKNKSDKKKKREVYALFSNKIQPWMNLKHEKDAAINLYDTAGLPKIKRALKIARENRQEDKFCPRVNTPYELSSKWGKIIGYKNDNL